MGSASTNVAVIQQSFMNNVTQVSQAYCQATAAPNVSGSVVILNGVNVKGNVTGVTSTSQADASCIIVSTMDNSVTQILEATTQQTNSTETDWFNGFQFTADQTVYDLSQSGVNNINQINQSTCTANDTPNVSNNYVYISGKVGGNFVG